jgi:CheY-like chemotaxis protein
MIMILFVDDERRRMSSYAEELEFSLDREVHFKTDVDSALEYLHEIGKGIELIILDVMMPPGHAFSEEKSEYGLKTGVLLYRKIRVNYVDVPIVIFTNASDEALGQEIQRDKKCILLQKEDYLPHDFAETLKNKFLGT